jgi:hypothetical protein
LIADRHQGVDTLVRGRDTVLRLSLVQDGDAVVPSSATVEVRSSEGALVASPTVTLAGTSTATLTGAATADRVLGDGWWVEWFVSVDGADLSFRHPAALCLRDLAPVITEADLWARNRTLDPEAARPLANVASLRRAVEQSWADIVDQLLGLGRRPWLILEPSALRGVHLQLALALVFEELATTNPEVYGPTAQHHRRNFDGAWRRLSFQYDAGDGRPGAAVDGGARRRPARGTTWLSAASDRY